MSTPAIRPTATGSANPLHINLSAPPVGTRTTITLERNTATSGVAVTTESTLISDIQEDAPGIIGCCVGFVKRTWTSICNWFLYVFHFFFPPSALSAITQVEQNLERVNHEQRRWMEERQREMVDMLSRVRPGEPPAVSATTAAATGSTPTTAPASNSLARPTMASLQLANEQRARLVEALRTLERIRGLVEAVSDTQIGTNSHWANPTAFKLDYRDTYASIERYLSALNDYSRYSQEGPEEKGGTRTPVSNIPDIVGVEQHTLNISNLVNPPTSPPTYDAVASVAMRSSVTPSGGSTATDTTRQ